jgi:ParB/RepB/Spo0J family partition protein
MSHKVHKEIDGLEYESKLERVPLDHIEYNVNNPREERGKHAIDDLKESIREMGVLVPLVVYPKPGSTNRFVLLEGERRLRACTELYEETKDMRFSKVPVNILQTRPNEFDTVRTMFNMHAKRRKWSRAAEAEALGKLIKMDQGRTSNPGKLADLTGLKELNVEEDLTYLSFSPRLRQLVTEDRIGQYNLILLGRNLKTIQAVFPHLLKEYGWGQITDVLVRKVERHVIRRARDFNRLSSLAHTCIENESENVYIEAFGLLMKEPKFGINEMTAFVDRELGYKVDELFKSRCEAFLEALGAHAEHRKLKLDPSIYDLLRKIDQLIGNVKPA